MTNNDADKGFVYNPLFLETNDTDAILAWEAPAVANTSWFFSPENAVPKKQQLLSAAQERVLFLQYNFARWKAKFCIKAADGQRQHGAAGYIADARGYEAIARTKCDVIISHNLGLVISMVCRVLGSQDPRFDDVKSDANMALLRSVELFDIARGWKFSTYACNGIINRCFRAIRDTNRHNGMMGAITEGWQHPATDPLRERRDEIDADAHRRLTGRLPRVMKRAGLGEKELRVIQLRFFPEIHGHEEGTCLSLEQVGRQMDPPISKERVRQIQVAAFEKIAAAW